MQYEMVQILNDNRAARSAIDTMTSVRQFLVFEKCCDAIDVFALAFGIPRRFRRNTFDLFAYTHNAHPSLRSRTCTYVIFVDCNSFIAVYLTVITIIIIILIYSYHLPLSAVLRFGHTIDPTDERLTIQVYPRRTLTCTVHARALLCATNRHKHFSFSPAP